MTKRPSKDDLYRIKEEIKFQTRMGRNRGKNSIPLTNIDDLVDMENNVIDAHAWCEDLDGNVVFDPSFIEHRVIQKFHNLTNEKIYKKFNRTLTRKIKKCLTKGDAYQINRMFPPEKILDKSGKYGYDYRNCFQLARAYNELHKDSKVIFGSWGFMGKDGTPHYEFG